MLIISIDGSINFDSLTANEASIEGRTQVFICMQALIGKLTSDGCLCKILVTV